MLDIDGHPMIQHVVEQLRPHFDSVMVSGGDERKYGFLGTRIVADKWPGDGPLSGIASALDVSSTEQNLVVSCDTPEIDIRLVRRMLREARGYDAVAPVLGETHTEPLFAVYHKRAGKTFAAALADGKRDVRGAVDRCRTKYVQVEPGWNLPNLNTRGEYEKFVAKRAEQGSGKEKDAQ